jgi:hypothetical protein
MIGEGLLALVPLPPIRPQRIKPTRTFLPIEHRALQ